MIVKQKHVPKIKLTELLRKRKVTLKKFIDDSGIACYSSLLERCGQLGVIPPSEEEFVKVHPIIQTSQSDGIIVVELVEPSNPLKFFDETSQLTLESEQEKFQPDVNEYDHSQEKQEQKQKRKKKVEKEEE